MSEKKPEHTDNNDVTPSDQSPRCNKCQLAVTDDRVKCTACGELFHLKCLTLKISPILYNTWQCDRCIEESRSNSSSKNKGKTSKSKSSSSRSSSIRKAALERIEEERQMNEKLLIFRIAEMAKINKDYLDKKYSLEIDSDDSLPADEESLHADGASLLADGEKVKQWLGKVPEVPAAPNDMVNRTAQFASTSNNKPAPNVDVPNLSSQFPEVSHNLTQTHIAARHSGLKTLPSFSGDCDEWPAFINSYYTTTAACGFDNTENLVRLSSSLKGEAKEAVKALLILPSTVPQAMSVLQMLYGQPERIINSLLKKIQELPVIKSDNLQGYIKLSTTVDNFVATIEALKMCSHLNNPCLLNDLVNKLPPEMKMNWGIYCGHVYDINLKSFSDWIRQRAYAAVKVSNHQPSNSNEHKSQRSKNYVNVHTEDQTKYVPKPCIKCGGSCSKIRYCEEFKAATVDERIAIVKEKKLCITCLGDHRKRCYSKRICGVNNCTSNHNSLLHRENTIADTLHHLDHTSVAPNKTWFRIVSVILYSGNHSIQCFAMLDEGSSVTLLDKDVADQLNVKGVARPLCLKWTGGSTRLEENSMIVNLGISGDVIDAQRFSLYNVHTVNDMDLPVQTISQEELNIHPHLRDLKSCTYFNAKPKLLIGLNNASFGIMREVREGKLDEPIASKTNLGWVIHGGTELSRSNSSNFSFHVCECQQLHEAVKSYFAFDSLGVVRSDKRIVSVDDAKALQILKDTTKRIGSRFVTGLIWKYDNANLPDSYSMAYRRLQCLESKMKKDRSLAENLRDQISSYESKGYIRKLTISELDEFHPRTWYLPIFTVTNPNKPNKTRIVWDAAARVNGVSLNSFLLSGPDQVSSLLGVLMRFRQKQIGVTADIQEMFHQVRVLEEDQHSQRFLWRESNDSPPDIYVMQVLTFGSTSSPASAQFVKNLNAKEHKLMYPDAAEAIENSHYVDDYLDSLSNENEAIQRCQDVSYVHKQAGFIIRNWLSNSPVVEDALNRTNLNSVKNMNISNEPEKILGMWWNKLDDTFEFHLKLNDLNKELILGNRAPTKRELLSVMMKIFDPLGLISNFMVFLKILLQEVWKSSISWDEYLQTPQLEKWFKWISYLPQLESLRIPRWHFSNQCVDDVVMHVFVDASIHAYAAVAYFQYATPDGFKCSLIAAKTKVAPIKLTSIPRLELQSAVLGVRLASTIQAEHSIQIKRCVFWTDSRTVLSWLNTNHQTLKQFVAFRVGEILEASNVKDWRYVPTKNNVADKATKWFQDRFSSTFQQWTNGPDFLQKEERYWPELIEICNTSETEVERVHFHIEERSQETFVDSSRFSSWTKMVRCSAFALRFINNLKSTLNKNKSKILSSEELKDAETVLLRQSQTQSFHNEIKALRDGKQIDKGSCLFKESAYLDEVGLIRVEGRIDAALGVTEDTKRPIILCRKNYISLLLVRSYHMKFHHLYDETALNEINQRFRIGKLRVLLKSVKSRCQRCKNKKAIPKAPMMSELPKCRLSSFTRPFTFIGLDFFGPLTVSVGRSSQKRWVLIVTCLVVRAVHVEVAQSLSTDSFILSLKNFIARRGCPREIYSDNGTNFRGAASEIRSFMTDKEKLETVAATFITTETSWIFNPPSSPHMGGSWERLVRSIKNTMNAIPLQRNPTDALLQTMLLECEMVINSRPLTYVALESESSEALTPNTFLLGSSSGAKPIGSFTDEEALLRQNWMKSEQYANSFWKRWTEEYLPTLTRRSKWFKREQPLKEGDIVIIVDQKNPRNEWPKGRIISILPGKNNQVRSAIVQTEKGIYTRPAVKLAVLDVYDGEPPRDVGSSPGGSVSDETQPTVST